MENHRHDSAARNCSSVKPLTRPAAMSSIRRTPSVTASLSVAGATTLSTKRRASSNRSSAESSNAAFDNSVADIGLIYFDTDTWQAGFYFKNDSACIRETLI